MIEQFLGRSLADRINSPHLLNHSKFIDQVLISPLLLFSISIVSSSYHQVQLLHSDIPSFTSPVFRFSFHQIRHVRLENRTFFVKCVYHEMRSITNEN